MTVTCTVTGPQLLQAASHGDTSKVRTLLSVEGAQSFINYQDATGTTPLNMAARRGHAPVAELLIAARCNVDLHDTEGYTPIHRAAFEGHEVVADKLILAHCNLDLPLQNEQIGARWNEHTGTPLCMAIFCGNTVIAEKLIAARCNVDLHHNNLPTPLQLAGGLVLSIINMYLTPMVSCHSRGILEHPT